MNMNIPLTPELDTRLREEEQWSRYYDLIEKRRQDTIESEELSELTSMSDEVEQFNVRRVKALAELAQLRRTTLPAFTTVRHGGSPNHLAIVTECRSTLVVDAAIAPVVDE